MSPDARLLREWFDQLPSRPNLDINNVDLEAMAQLVIERGSKNPMLLPALARTAYEYIRTHRMH